MIDDTGKEHLLSSTTDNPIEDSTQGEAPTVDDGLHVTRTYYDLLAEEIIQDLDKVAAKIPKLEAHQRASART